jgi:HK97 family phage portal protein
MKLVSRIRRAVVRFVAKQLTLSGVGDNRGWITLLRSGSDTTTGSWQQDSGLTQEAILGFAPVYACTTLIASDIGKICLRLMTLTKEVWIETESPAFSPVLRKPNHFQTRQQFIECWILSKLRRGNTYVLKMRDNRKVINALYVLDPDRVTPLVAPDGSVFYELQRDDLSKLPQNHYPAIPASEIIHDRMECLFHPLVGIPPLFAAALASSQGLRIQKNSEVFFKNMSRPGGMLTAPGNLDDETVARLKTEFEANFSNEKIGRLFVGGDGLKYDPMAHTADESQLVDQLNLSALQVCSAFHVPAYMIGAGPVPSYTNVEALNQQYYTQCLQKFFNAIEDLWDDGFAMRPLGYRTEFDLDDLLRMDTATRVKSTNEAITGGWLAPNEGRGKFGYLPVKGGESPMMQQQNWNLEQLAEREAPKDSGTTAAPPATPPNAANDTQAAQEQAAAMAGAFIKGLNDFGETMRALVKPQPPESNDDDADEAAEMARAFIAGLTESESVDNPVHASLALQAAAQIQQEAENLATAESIRLDRIEQTQESMAGLLHEVVKGQSSVIEALNTPVVPEYDGKGKLISARRKK